MKPTHLHHDVGHDAVLCLSARMGDHVLALQEAGVKVVVQKHSIAQSGPAFVGTICSSSVSVDDEV
jgi:hypothetical protein